MSSRRLAAALVVSFVALALAGCQPTLAVDALEPNPRLVQFGEVPVNTTVEQVVTLRNAGDGPLERLVFLIGAPAGTPLRFSFVPPAEEPVNLEPGASLDLTVRYMPEVAAADEAEILVRTPYQEDWGELIHLRGSGK